MASLGLGWDWWWATGRRLSSSTGSLLGTGTHSLAFTPGVGSIYIKFENRERRAVIVDSCAIEAAGVLTLPTAWPTASLSKIQYAPSGDVIFCACESIAQQKIERRSTPSWSVVSYQSRGGPFRAPKPREQNIKLKLEKAN